MGAVLPLLYPDAPKAVLEDVASAPIPELHKDVFRWVRTFTRHSWELTPADLDRLRSHRIADADLVHWAQIAALQGWWTMSADGGGIPLEGNAITGPVVQRRREQYEASEEGLTAAAPGSTEPVPGHDGPCWVATDLESDAWHEIAAWADDRYGFVPQILAAVSLRPEMFPRHQLALELLERPQTQRLSPRQHALVRAQSSILNRCAYTQVTTRSLLERTTGDGALFHRIASGDPSSELGVDDRLVLAFASKLVRNAYKVTEKDALAFREVGLGDLAYVDVLNTAAIQTSFDRLANALGVPLDDAPLLP